AGPMVGSRCLVREAGQSVRSRRDRHRAPRRPSRGGRVKIKLFHDVCGREMLVQQILQSDGHCPWDGLAFTAQYTAILTEALQTVEGAGTVLENALETIAGLEPRVQIVR